MCFVGKMTGDYWKALAENPDSDRQTAIKTAYESVGWKLLFLVLSTVNGIFCL